MRRVVGKGVVELPEPEFSTLRQAHRHTVLDVGTGDGKHALHIARQHLDWLVVGLDANRDNMRRVAQRARAKPERGGQPNLVFVWAAAEQLPAELREIDEIHVLMPWGSLLRGLLGSDDLILNNLAAVTRPGGTMQCVLNLHAWRPPVPEVDGSAEPTPDWVTGDLAVAYLRSGWKISEAHYASDTEVDALATGWTRRLSSSRHRLDALAFTATAVGSDR